jgi:ribosomal protein S18 acetylase RimI-like enzyme
MEGAGLEPERGWITSLGVHPGRWGRGAGSALLDRAQALFREAGRREALLSPYTPNYFVPGVDVVRYARGLAFLERRGFEVISRPLSMDANIVLFDEDRWRKGEGALREEGIEVRGLRPGEIPSLMEFLKAHMPGDWARHAREALLDALRDAGEEPPFIVAVRDAEVVGYCQFEGEHFGPFGVRTDMQGRGIGTLAMARCLAAMRRRGHHNAWVLWTSDEAARRVYDRFGFRETRRFAILRRRL